MTKIQEYCSGIDKHQRIKSESSMTSIDTFMRKNHGNLRDALGEPATYTTNRVPQSRINLRTEQNK